MSLAYMLCVSMTGSHSPQQMSASLVQAFPGLTLILFSAVINER